MRIAPALLEPAISDVRKLFREYSHMPGVVPWLDDFELEVPSLAGAAAPPGGRRLLAVEDGSESAKDAIGCVALRKLEQDTCEMKRLYGRPEFRGTGAARKRVAGLIAEAGSIGYPRIVLDTLPS